MTSPLQCVSPCGNEGFFDDLVIGDVLLLRCPICGHQGWGHALRERCADDRGYRRYYAYRDPGRGKRAGPADYVACGHLKEIETAVLAVSHQHPVLLAEAPIPTTFVMWTNPEFLVSDAGVPYARDNNRLRRLTCWEEGWERTATPAGARVVTLEEWIRAVEVSTR